MEQWREVAACDSMNWDNVRRKKKPWLCTITLCEKNEKRKNEDWWTIFFFKLLNHFIHILNTTNSLLFDCLVDTSLDERLWGAKHLLHYGTFVIV